MSGAIIAVVACLIADPALAENNPAGERMPPTPADSRKGNIYLQGALALSAGAAWFALSRKHQDWARLSCPCARDQVNRWDRFAVTHRLSSGERFADLTLALGLGLSGALLALQSADWSANARDLVLIGETLAVTGLATQMSKTLVSRPYPYMYRPAPFPEQNDDGINYASFWSGHTAVPMAVSVSVAYLLWERYPDSGLAWTAILLGPTLALAAGLFQVGASNHFPSDVVVGGAVGAAVGYLNPAFASW